MSKIEFLKPGTDEIRHQILGILDSYSHDWDILSELTQNSVDAIREANPTKGHVRITVNAATRQILISDNGLASILAKSKSSFAHLAQTSRGSRIR